MRHSTSSRLRRRCRRPAARTRSAGLAQSWPAQAPITMASSSARTRSEPDPHCVAGRRMEHLRQPLDPVDGARPGDQELGAADGVGAPAAHGAHVAPAGPRDQLVQSFSLPANSSTSGSALKIASGETWAMAPASEGEAAAGAHDGIAGIGAGPRHQQQAVADPAGDHDDAGRLRGRRRAARPCRGAACSFGGHLLAALRHAGRAPQQADVRQDLAPRSAAAARRSGCRAAPSDRPADWPPAATAS